MAYGPTEDERVLSFTPPKPTPIPLSTSQSAPPHPTPPSDPLPYSLENLSLRLRATWNDTRPWAEFYSTRHISPPPFATLSDRISANLHIYRANYLVVTAFWLFLAVLGAIPSFVLAALGAYAVLRWCLYRAGTGGLTNRDKAVAGGVALVLVWVTGVGGYLVAGLAFSALSVAVHAALHEGCEIETEIATV